MCIRDRVSRVGEELKVLREKKSKEEKKKETLFINPNHPHYKSSSPSKHPLLLYTSHGKPPCSPSSSTFLLFFNHPFIPSSRSHLHGSSLFLGAHQNHPSSSQSHASPHTTPRSSSSIIIITFINLKSLFILLLTKPKQPLS